MFPIFAVNMKHCAVIPTFFLGSWMLLNLLLTGYNIEDDDLPSLSPCHRKEIVLQ